MSEAPPSTSVKSASVGSILKKSESDKKSQKSSSKSSLRGPKPFVSLSDRKKQKEIEDQKALNKAYGIEEPADIQELLEKKKA